MFARPGRVITKVWKIRFRLLARLISLAILRIRNDLTTVKAPFKEDVELMKTKIERIEPDTITKSKMFQLS